MPQFTLPEDEKRPVFNTEEFWELQIHAKIELEKLINAYTVTHRVAGAERVDHALTQHRRDLLRSISVVDKKHTDEDGAPVIYWDQMLKYAHIAIQGFNREDIQR